MNITSTRSTPTMSSAPKATPERQVLDTPELLAIIIGFLKDDYVSQSPKPSDGKTKWKRNLTQLLTVNSMFFRVTIDLLWEEVESLGPFLAMITYAYASRGSMELDDGIGPEAWNLFQLYASRTKKLTLDHTALDACWTVYIAMSPRRPLPLFPLLKELTFASGGSMPLLVAMDSCSTLAKIRIALSEDTEAPVEYEVVAALTASLVENAKQLSTMELEHPVDTGILRNISKISSLRNLYVHIRTGGAAEITPLLELTSLQSLSLKVVGIMADQQQGPLVGGVLSRMLAARQHSKLEDLAVAAHTDTQIAIAKLLGPTSLKSLRLTVCYTSGPERSSQALSLVIAAYIARSPGLVSLTVGSICSFKHPNLNRMGTSIDWTPEFCARLSALTGLERLDLTGIILPTPDFIRQVFKTLPNFPKLQRFRFTPHSASSHVEPWVLPTFEDLAQIPIHNPLLSSLAMPIDSRSCVPFLHGASSPALKYLSLAFHPSLRNQLTHDSVLKVSLFLDQLFPCIRSLTSNFEPTSPQKVAWKPVKQMMDAYQLVRARVTQNVTPGFFSSS